MLQHTHFYKGASQIQIVLAFWLKLFFYTQVYNIYTHSCPLWTRLESSISFHVNYYIFYHSPNWIRYEKGIFDKMFGSYFSITRASSLHLMGFFNSYKSKLWFLIMSFSLFLRNKIWIDTILNTIKLSCFKQPNVFTSSE